MPTWGEILNEFRNAFDIAATTHTPPDTDRIRRNYLQATFEHTGRPIILYASNWLKSLPPDEIMIVDGDLQGFMEVVHKVPGPNLDLILHSPGGSAEAAGAIVNYLRSKYSHIRVIVPMMAMSAATMIAHSADEIVMGKHSFLGPIDPQFLLQTSIGKRPAPAQAILDQFEMAKNECRDPRNLPAWLKILENYGPDLLAQSQTLIDRSKEIVEEWLKIYMFKGDENKDRNAHEIAEWLGTHGNFKSHGKKISRDELKQHGVIIHDLESDEVEQDMFLSIFHATTHTFNFSPVAKIIENHLGRAYVSILQQVILGAPNPPPPAPTI